MLNPHEIFSAGRLVARSAAPYFSAMLNSIVPVEAPGLGTVGVSKSGVMVWDPEFVSLLGPDKNRAVRRMAGIWIHEVMHLCLEHGKRAERFARNPIISNWAGDLAINPSVVEIMFDGKPLELPDGQLSNGRPFKVLWPKQFGLKDGLTLDEYYEHLVRQQPKQMQAQGDTGADDGEGGEEGDGEGGARGGQGDGNGGGEDADHDNPGGGDPKVGAGWCGSCGGRPVPGEPKTDKEIEDAGGRGDQEMKRIARQVAEEMREHASRSQGRLPGGWDRWAADALEPPKVPWQAKLGQLIRTCVGWRPGAVDHRYDGPSRRQAGIGFGPGRPVLPRLRQPVPRVGVCVDTSGSMGKEELTAAARETNGILKAIGAEVDFCAADCEVHSMEKVRKWEDLIPLFKGGGGTSFVPAIEAMYAQRPRPEVVVFITDGMGEAPALEPVGMRVIWLLVGPYRTAPCKWGEVIELDTSEKRAA